MWNRLMFVREVSWCSWGWLSWFRISVWPYLAYPYWGSSKIMGVCREARKGVFLEDDIAGYDQLSSDWVIAFPRLVAFFEAKEYAGLAVGVKVAPFGLWNVNPGLAAIGTEP